MSMVGKVAAAHRRGGLREVLNRVGRRLPGGAEYQEKVAPSFRERWEMIRSQIPGDARNLLDIGCNLADFTAAAAAIGLWSIGIEIRPKVAAKARKRHSEGTCAVMCAELNLETCRKLPEFDVILLLSVHHNWYNAYGKAVADEMVKTVAAKSRVLVFEGPSRLARFTRDIPDFTTNDEVSVTEYYDKYLDGVAGSQMRVRRIGKSACVGEREPYRWMYALTR